MPREPSQLGCARARSCGPCSFPGQQNEQRLSVWAPAPGPAAGWWPPSEATCLCTCEQLRLARLLLFHWLQPLRPRECLPACLCLSSLACGQTVPRPHAAGGRALSGAPLSFPGPPARASQHWKEPRVRRMSQRWFILTAVGTLPHPGTGPRAGWRRRPPGPVKCSGCCARRGLRHFCVFPFLAALTTPQAQGSNCTRPSRSAGRRSQTAGSRGHAASGSPPAPSSLWWWQRSFSSLTLSGPLGSHGTSP